MFISFPFVDDTPRVYAIADNRDSRQDKARAA
jgi:hypothetical protein